MRGGMVLRVKILTEISRGGCLDIFSTVGRRWMFGCCHIFLLNNKQRGKMC
jgi:hypothetical protein